MPRGAYIRTKEIRKKISDTLKGNIPWNKGLTKEIDERVAKNARSTSEGMKGYTPWNKNLTKKTDERMAKIARNLSKVVTKYFEDPRNRGKTSKAILKKWQDPEYRAKQKDCHKGIKYPEEEYPNFGMRGKHLSGMTREKQSISGINAHMKPDSLFNSPEYIINLKYKAKRRWADPGFREKMIKIFNCPEFIAKSSEDKKKKWQNPEYQKMMAIARDMKPNNLEQFFNKLTPNAVRYVGDFNFFITTNKQTHNPDFKVKGQKKIIELFGDYWHRGEDPNELIREYKEVDWDCKIFWESEVYNKTEEVIAEVKTFVKEWE